PGQDVELLDSESGTKVEVSLDARAIAASRARLFAFFEELEGYAKKRGLFYGRIDARHSLDDVVVGYLRQGAR
ncbi:MAG: hypothetical protein ACK5U8_04320, partial [Deltaproteobacteria bacterium]